MRTWKAGTDCCSWNGVRCNKKTGDVVSLDLSMSWLQGPLLPNSSLFRLNQLQKVNLAYNNFSFCSIPSEFGQLSRLTYLNLSFSEFSGIIPSKISWLTKLISLDLSSYSYFFYEMDFLFLRKVDQTRFIKNLTNLRELHLSGVNLSSSSPLLESLVNLSSLTSISLYGCGLVGEFPKSIFLLHNLQSIDASNNLLLTGFLPEFNSSSNLKSIHISMTNFSGTLPDSIGNLKSLKVLDLSNSYFSGTVPSSIGNLSQLTSLGLSSNNFYGRLPDSISNLKSLNTMGLDSCNFSGTFPSSLENLSQITFIDLSRNEFHGQLPSLRKLVKLTVLSLSSNKFSGEIISSLLNVTQLGYFDVSTNNFDGGVPSFLFNMSSMGVLSLSGNRFTGPLIIQNISSTHLEILSLSGNKLNGRIPSSISKLAKLVILELNSNSFSGTVDLGIFSKMKNIKNLDLSDNSLSISNVRMISTLPMFWILTLSSCNISEFPGFLKDQNHLTVLDLSNNKIGGLIPKWFLSIGIETLYFLDLSSNFISGWEEAPLKLPWKILNMLDFHSNQLRGSPVVPPPPSILFFLISENNLTGRIHPLFCELSNLKILDMSNNQLDGTIPQCLGNFSNSLEILDLKGNNFHGNIPHMSTNASNLKTLDLSYNHLQGKVPKSLLNCKDLEVLNLGHNKINDKFPFWLQNLSELQVLVLRSNNFYGPIWDPHKFFGFMKLRIIDLSFNNFSGSIPSEYFSNWSSMIKPPDGNESQLHYMGHESGYYVDSVIVMNKGMEILLVKIITIFTSFDLSNNRFNGKIPSTIGDLQSLIVLNLSSNSFTGLMPSSLENLTKLESLDLSKNKLNGRIPQELTSLTFLAYLNLSENNFTGPIPQGRQFNTFLNSSFEGNPGLCGTPLSNKCEYNNGTPSSEPDNESESVVGFSWKIVLMGYACGVVIGVVIGHVTISRRLNWFLIRTFCGNIRI
ncbi:receptor-like protein 6 [Ziziphus jujuba]|uniref:Receptor-like protein 6 n=1 Tax=Ziziphus jujuba TaxID=326968 RepID=A0ABM3IAY3_ZIZJJ|nr:receptor-like protein 6 [Ziziphus jujuba]